MATLEAINKQNMIFLSAQPDELYFHWQVELYLYQFAKHGIEDRCYALFGYCNRPSTYALNLAKKFKHILFYKDDRKTDETHDYAPTIRPHLLKQFFKDYPNLGTNVFYHDSDIFLVKLPPFELMLEDNICYVSNTINYIGSNYIELCQKRYTEKYPTADSILKRMCDTVGVSVDCVKQNELHSGGAQYLLKNTNAFFWEEAERLCHTLFKCIKEYDKQYPVDHGIQAWTTDMWVVLWLLWKHNTETRVHPALDFSWAIDSNEDYHKMNIFHLAGVTPKNGEGKFYKGAFHIKNVFTEYAKDPQLLDFINPTNATYEYVVVLKEYAKTLQPQQPICYKFSLVSKYGWASKYKRDTCVTKYGKSVWRSVNKSYLIIYNGMQWIITQKKYENEIGAGSIGCASNTQNEPYENGWDKQCSIILI
jgi:hypothetical protein